MTTAPARPAETAKAEAEAGRGLDPRARILAVAGFAVSVSVCRDPAALALALGAAVATAAALRVPLRSTLTALLHVEAILAAVVLTLPFATPGEALLRLGPFSASDAGVALAAALLVKVTAIALAVIALVGTLDAADVAMGLAGLRVPGGLVDLFLLANRYVGLIGREYARLQTAMAARAFVPRGDVHTWRSYGTQVGMLLVLSLERAERVLMAMTCRGYDGRLHHADPMAPPDRGTWRFAAAWLGLLMAITGLELR